MALLHTAEEIAYLPATELIHLFRARELSPLEVLEAQLARAEALAETVNAFTWRFDEAARHQAREAEARYLGKGPEPRPLEGVTLAIKEEMAVAGQPLTSASRVMADAIADHSSPLAERVLAAGAIVHARTTQPEFGCTSFTQSDLFGVTRNPWNLDYDVGGSSGGAGAALAAGLATLAAGSDIGGSIRIPAACCGVVGFKPPYGRVPQDPPFNLDHYCHEGPLARTVADCALFQNTISGPASTDIASLRERVELPLEPTGISGLRVALSLTLGEWEPDEEVRHNTLAAAHALRDAGATVEEVDVPLRREDVDRASNVHYATIFGPSVAASAARGHDVMTSYALAFAQSAVLDRTGATLDGLECEGAITAMFGALLEHFDALLCPTLAIPALRVDDAWPAGEQTGHSVMAAFDHPMTIPFNIASRCPVLNVPSGFAASGVPTGVQLVGRTFEDETPFRLGAALERAGLWDYGVRRPPLLA